VLNNNLKTISIPGFLKTFNLNRDYLYSISQREVELNPDLMQKFKWQFLIFFFNYRLIIIKIVKDESFKKI
jgi:hypothetical protein